MLMLQFQCGDDRYGLDVSQIVEVAPMVALKPIPHAPDAVAGLLNYRGILVPVIDLCFLLSGNPARPLISTRIVLSDYTGADGKPHILGLLAERATEMISCRETDFQSPVISTPDAPYLGAILIDKRGAIQKIGIRDVLSKALQELLFAEERLE